MKNLQYPIGPFVSQETYTTDELTHIIDVIETSPDAYRRLIDDLLPHELAKTYRPGSWTVEQLVHHVSDIGLLHFFRLKKAITEADYEAATLIDMNAWATTVDAVHAPVSDSLAMFEGTHRRYARLARSLTPDQLAIRYYHPVRQIWFTQAQALAISAWHVQHHLAHIKLALAG
ncbi:DinB family protein [Spirosoma aerophilum]